MNGGEAQGESGQRDGCGWLQQFRESIPPLPLASPTIENAVAQATFHIFQ